MILGSPHACSPLRAMLGPLFRFKGVRAAVGMWIVQQRSSEVEILSSGERRKCILKRRVPQIMTLKLQDPDHLRSIISPPVRQSFYLVDRAVVRVVRVMTLVVFTSPS